MDWCTSPPAAFAGVVTSAVGSETACCGSGTATTPVPAAVSTGGVEVFASTGVTGAAFFTSLGRLASLFFSSVRRKTRIVVRNALCGLQSSADSGLCSQTGHESGKLDWPGGNEQIDLGHFVGAAKTYKIRRLPSHNTVAGRRLLRALGILRIAA
jgi:hypothetical protein